jgi:hypothetical protein
LHIFPSRFDEAATICRAFVTVRLDDRTTDLVERIFGRKKKWLLKPM